MKSKSMAPSMTCRPDSVTCIVGRNLVVSTCDRYPRANKKSSRSTTSTCRNDLSNPCVGIRSRPSCFIFFAVDPVSIWATSVFPKRPCVRAAPLIATWTAYKQASGLPKLLSETGPRSLVLPQLSQMPQRLRSGSPKYSRISSWRQRRVVAKRITLSSLSCSARCRFANSLKSISSSENRFLRSFTWIARPRNGGT